MPAPSSEKISSFLTDTLVVVVLFRKRMNESLSLRSLSTQTIPAYQKMDVMVYDNSSQSDWRTNCEGNPIFNWTYIPDRSNPGVSKAYNQGFEVARRQHKQRLLLLDQDTLFPAGTLSAYAAAITKYNNPPLLAPILKSHNKIYSPCRQVCNWCFSLPSVTTGEVPVSGKSLLNSGMCIHLDAFEKAGGFDERIPLDFADHDFMKRYRTHFNSFVLLDVICSHGFRTRKNKTSVMLWPVFASTAKGRRTALRVKERLFHFSLWPLSGQVGCRCDSTTQDFLRFCSRYFSLINRSLWRRNTARHRECA